MSVKESLIIAAMLFGASSCSLPFTNSPEPKTFYELQLPSSPQLVPDAVRPLRLLIQEVRGTPLLASRTILYRPQANTIAGYQLTQWSESLTDQLTTLFLDYLRNAGGFSIVARSNSGIVGDVQFVSELRDFSYHLGDGKPKVKVVLVAELVQLSDRTALSQRVFSLEEELRGEGVSDVIAAFELLTNRLLEGVTAWVEQSVPRTKVNLDEKSVADDIS